MWEWKYELAFRNDLFWLCFISHKYQVKKYLISYLFWHHCVPSPMLTKFAWVISNFFRKSQITLIKLYSSLFQKSKFTIAIYLNEQFRRDFFTFLLPRQVQCLLLVYYLHKILLIKVHIFWEGLKVLRNLHHKFVLCSNGQIYGGYFVKCFGLLRIYELYLNGTEL